MPGREVVAALPESGRRGLRGAAGCSDITEHRGQGHDLRHDDHGTSVAELLGALSKPERVDGVQRERPHRPDTTSDAGDGVSDVRAVVGREVAGGIARDGIWQMVLPGPERHPQCAQVEPHRDLRVLADGEQVGRDAPRDRTSPARHVHDDHGEDDEGEQQHRDVQQDGRGEQIRCDRTRQTRHQRGEAAEGQRAARVHDVRCARSAARVRVRRSDGSPPPPAERRPDERLAPGAADARTPERPAR